jgi:hypothetical protein
MTARRFISLFAVLALVLTLGFTALPVSANGSGNSLEAALASSPMGTIVYDGTQPYLRVDCFLPGDICYAPVVDGVLEGNNTVTPSMPGLYCVTRGYNISTPLPNRHYLKVEQSGMVSDCFEAIPGRL